MDNQLILNKYGYYELFDKPTRDELDEYYSKKYYQAPTGSYDSAYSTEEIEYVYTQLDRKMFLLNKYMNSSDSNEQPQLLDIGCGEGWALKYFKEKSWQVCGMDYSEFGCKNFNSDLLPHVIVGDVQENIKSIAGNALFDCILIDNVLEHVLDPFQLLSDCSALLKDKGILIVEVPNDFSSTQLKLFDEKYISKKFWICPPDHISYFNREGLQKICQEVGFSHLHMMGDYPIDFNLFNSNTNYVNDRSKGKSCHFERITIENFLNDISIEKTIAYYSALCELGLGRQLIGFFQKN
jgi:2-polyprenyl-3-methyl-5-hydroxy-6-metoxy-1,4-benzoquinol methylase